MTVVVAENSKLLLTMFHRCVHYMCWYRYPTTKYTLRFRQTRGNVMMGLKRRGT